uniref:Uncharacterized protein n=1 Tax=Arundo donax TaxID=35708 RepID=A0A0A9DFG2_ARUDO
MVFLTNYVRVGQISFSHRCRVQNPSTPQKKRGIDTLEFWSLKGRD